MAAAVLMCTPAPLLDQMVLKSRRHLYSDGDLNNMVTTMTLLGHFIGSASDKNTENADPQHLLIASGTLIGAAQEVAEDPAVADIQTGKSVFRNACNLRVSVWSQPRNCTRTIAIKVFGNMSLQITGSHSVDLAEAACDLLAMHIVDRLRRSHPMLSKLSPRITSIAMANFKACLTDKIHIFNMYKRLTQQNVLVVYDPSARDSAANVKLPFDGKMCSIRVFESGKMIVSIPNVGDRDAALGNMLYAIHTLIQPQVKTMQGGAAP